MKKSSKKPNNFWLKNKLIDLIYIVFLLGLTFYTWRLLPDLVIKKDGFVYLFKDMQRFWHQDYAITGFETAAVAFGGLFTHLFGSNMKLYLIVELIWILLISITFFILVKIITKKSIVAFSAAIIASVSYFGNWDMLGVRCYCFFLERVTVVPLLFISFIFLHLYLERAKRKYYLISLGFYFLGVGLAHFSVLFTAPFLFYPFFYRLFNHKKKKEVVWGAFIGISYLLLSTFFVLIQQINESGLRPSWGFFEFMLNPQKFNYVESIMNQLVFWSQYPPIIQNLENSFPFPYLSLKNAQEIRSAIILVYFLSAIFVYFQLKRQRAILVTSIFGVITILYLNSYFHLYDIAAPDSNRYMYFPTFLYAIFWSHFLWALFFKHNKVLIFTGILLLAGYYLINSILIKGRIIEVIVNSEGTTKEIFNKFYEINDFLPSGTLVVGSYPEIGSQEGFFFTERLGKGKVIYISDNNPNLESIASSSAKVIKFSYDKRCNCVVEENIK